MAEEELRREPTGRYPLIGCGSSVQPRGLSALPAEAKREANATPQNLRRRNADPLCSSILGLASIHSPAEGAPWAAVVLMAVALAISSSTPVTARLQSKSLAACLRSSSWAITHAVLIMSVKKSG